jgi:hypothetical protein
MKSGWTTAGRRKLNGDLDGCDHVHDTRDAAQACLAQHQREQQRRGRISERTIVAVDDLDSEDAPFYGSEEDRDRERQELAEDAAELRERVFEDDDWRADYDAFQDAALKLDDTEEG